MKVFSLNNYLSKEFPVSMQESYDNAGTQLLFHEDDIRGIYITLDIDNSVIEDAINNDCNVILSHHPFIFKSIKMIDTSLVKSRQLLKFFENRISVYSMHTNFDRCMWSYLSSYLGYGNGDPLLDAGEYMGDITGFGSIVELDNPVRLKSIIENILGKIRIDFLTYSGSLTDTVASIAFLNGSGGSQIEKIINLYRPHCIITGDVGYHNMKYAIDSGVSVIDAGHFGTEIIFKKKMNELVADCLKEYGEKIHIQVSDAEKNPFKVYSL